MDSYREVAVLRLGGPTVTRARDLASDLRALVTEVGK